MDPNSAIVDVKLGDFMIMLLNSRGEVYIMGENIDGQLGISESYGPVIEMPMKVPNLPPISQIACGRNHCFAVSADL